MKVRHQLERIEPMVLDPIEDLPEEHWHRAPNGRWSIAQIVGHLAISTDLISAKLAERAGRDDMRRRATPKQQLLRHLALGMGKLPNPRRIPASAQPPDAPEPEIVSAQFRMAIERFDRMMNRWSSDDRENIFVAHPHLGDLNLPEWVRFFYLHCRYGAQRIETRRRWLRRANGQ